MQLKVLSAEEVRAALPMPKAIEAMRIAFGQLSAGEADVPPRSHLDTERGVTLVMSALLRRSMDMAVKVVSVYPENPRFGMPAINAVVVVVDPETGMPNAILDGGSLTAIRTGAAGGLSAELLSRRDSKTVALFGAGVQARTQLEAVLTVRRIDRLNLISRSEESASRFAGEIAKLPNAPKIRTGMTPEEAVSDADIIITATTAKTPLFDGNAVKPGTHMIAIGSFKPDVREIDSIAVNRARVVVDSVSAAMEEAGDLIMANAEIDAEIGEIINGVKPGRISDDEITLFKSVGVAVQDAAAAAAVLANVDRGK